VVSVVHVQSSRGGMVMSAHSPYDRQLLREHVERLVSPTGTLRLGLDGNEWIVTRLAGGSRRCHQCTEPLKRLGCRREDSSTTLCIACVLQPATEHAQRGEMS